ncbi:MAG: YfiT family bacillithiol transferase [Flavisolibacter sp.]
MQTTASTITEDLMLQYPIGVFERPKSVGRKEVESWIEELEKTPDRLWEMIWLMTPEQLQTPYRPGGWTVLQLVHHLSDSHMNGYIRLKLALTEDNPLVRPYRQEKWAELPDGTTVDLRDSLNILRSVHAKWVRLLRTLNEEQLERTYRHPEWEEELKISDLIANYAWHSRHHLRQIENLRQSKGW